MKHLVTVFLLAACVSPSHDAEARTGRFFVEVIGHTALVRAGRPEARDSCTLGSAENHVLAVLRRVGNETEVQLTYEEMPAPAFASTGEGVQPPDRMAVVRGQVIAPWCDSAAFYWIRSVRPGR